MSVDTQRAAVITGGTSGIGKQIAHRLTADGYAVVLGCAGNEVAAETTVWELTEYGEKPLAMRAVVAEEADVVALRRRRDVRR
jgi:3-oxoacyl-[acyl-carrier protein] reductase